MRPRSPGWYRDDDQNLMRWWDGETWSDPSRDARLQPGTPTAVDGVVLQFTSDPSWPEPPVDWFPSPLWEPGSGWPKPAGKLWRATGLDAEDLLAELSHHRAIRQQEVEQPKDLWRLDGRDGIPFIWLAPPNWPSPPRGWSPPEGWEAPRQWGRAPEDWQFWQQDPSIIAYKTAAIHTKADQRSRALVKSTVGIASLLSEGEALLCDAVRLTPLTVSPLPSAARNGLPVGAPPHLTQTLQDAHYHLNWCVSNLRLYLLRLAYELGQPDEWLWQLRRDLNEATESYEAAAKAAAEGVFSATVEHVEREVTRTKRTQTGRVAELRSVFDELSNDIKARAEALRSLRYEPELSDSAPLVGDPPDWKLAEEFASNHLRSLGFMDAQCTPVGADGGFDVAGRGVVAQVKYWTSTVGRPDIQRLVGANRHGATAVFYSRAGYARSAIDYASHTGVALFQIDLSTSRITAVNDVARTLSNGFH